MSSNISTLYKKFTILQHKSTELKIQLSTLFKVPTLIRVVKAIKEISSENSENLTAENSAVKSFFSESTYINERDRTYRCYDITRNGFLLLVMGFTGKKALEWKIK